MKMQTIRLPSDNALRCRALAQENAALRAAAARWAQPAWGLWWAAACRPPCA